MSDNETPLPVPVRKETVKTYGKVLHRSRKCVVCTHRESAVINLMRARDHLSLDEISEIKGISKAALRIHFDNHFIVNKTNSDIIALKEDASPEANEIVESIIEGDIDIFAGAQGILESKAQRLNPILSRLKELTSTMETEKLEDFETQEYVALNKLAESIENSMLKTYQIVDKRLLPFKREELSNAILSYKLKILKKMLDKVQLVLLEFEKVPNYRTFVAELRSALAEHFNKIEDDILQSGGTLTNPYEGNSNSNSFTRDARDLEFAKAGNEVELDDYDVYFDEDPS